ncbi:MAG TPA: DUF6569 family protein [Gaiellaceae bacterium]|nr:DUF6569 family protein [Gaiellaceae bacterium]
MTPLATTTLPFTTGEPASFAGLALVPLFPAAEPSLEYVGLDEAVARGLAVTELDEAGTVGTLLVSNPLDASVLVYEGEELAGAKQNRILDRPVLVPAQSRTPVPVTCVERGRWHYRSARLEPAPRAAYPELRLARATGGQAAAWASVSAKAARLDALSPTEAAGEIYASRAPALEAYLAKLPRREGQCGAVVCVGGRVVCLDYVSRSEVYAGLYAKLLRGYALDALERPADAPVPLDRVERLLARLARAPRRPVELVGLGQASALDSRRLAGVELAVAGEVVALAAFPL